MDKLKSLGWKGALVVFVLGGLGALANSLGLVDIATWLDSQKPVVEVAQ